MKEVARLYATLEAASSPGVGIRQQIPADNARCLIALALTTARRRPARPAAARGKNNVRRSRRPDSDVTAGNTAVGRPICASLLKSLASGTIRRGCVVEIMNAIHAGEITGMYIEGENPAMSDPDLQHARGALAMLDHLVVQDLFVTETAFHADVILPASAFAEKSGTFTNTDRRVQLAREVIKPLAMRDMIS